MSKDAPFPEDKTAVPTMKPHRPPTRKKKKKRQRRKHGLRDGKLPESEPDPAPEVKPKKNLRTKTDKSLEPPLQVKGRPVYLPSLSDPDPFLIERLLGTPLVF